MARRSRKHSLVEGGGDLLAGAGAQDEERGSGSFELISGVFIKLRDAFTRPIFDSSNENFERSGAEYDSKIGKRSNFTENRDRFFEAVQRVQHSTSYTASNIFKAPYGYFGGRFIIGERTRITGGVYISASPHEAIVVDPRYGSLNQVYQRLLAKAELRQSGGMGFKEGILSDVFALVQQTLRYSPEEVSRLSQRKSIKADQKVALDLFVEEGVGVARHHVLLAGYLLERLRDNGFISGSVFIDAQTNHPTGEDDRLIYANSGGSIYVVDPRAAYLGEKAYCREMGSAFEGSAATQPEGRLYLH